MTRKRFALLRLTLACVCALLGVSSAATAAPLHLAVSSGPVSLLIYVAESQGLFQQQGLDVVHTECYSGRACLKLLTEDTVDLATSADLVLALGSFVRKDLAIIGTVSASSHQIKLVARRSAGITGPEQMRGKRVATVQGTSAQYFLDSWLLFHGIENQAIRPLFLRPDNLGAVLQNGDIDAIAIWEPLAGNALKALGDDGLALPNPRIYTQHFALVTTRADISTRRSDFVKLLRALVRAQQLVREQPHIAAQLLMRRLNIDAAAALALMKEQDYRVRLDQSLISTLSGELRWAVREGHAKSDGELPNPLRMVDSTLLREASPSSLDPVK
ncbi:MAG: ABC transporter substrate-binding protein [Rhodoferax sp.]|nr:ABC transporter substrate-binding protein [Rhodoferax sp.]